MPGRLPARSHGRRADGCHLHDHHGRRAGHPDALAAAESPARAVRAADAGLGRPRRARGRRRRRGRRCGARDGRGRSRRRCRTCRVVVQSPANGTGDAVRVGPRGGACRGGARGRALGRHAADRARDRARARSRRAADGAGGALVSARLAPPHAYGRIVRDGERVARIVEARDADARGARAGRVQRRALLLPARRAGGGPAAAHRAQRAGRALPDRRRSALLAEDGAAPSRSTSRRRRRARASTRWSSWPSARRGLRARILRDHMLAGVRIVDPATTYVDGGVRLEPGCRLEPNVMLRGATAVGAGSVIGPNAMIDDGTIGERCRVGPFAYLRPGCTLADGAQVGRFVELKNTDARRARQGAAPELRRRRRRRCGQQPRRQHDHRQLRRPRKHRTTIGEGVSTMVHSTLVAPVTIGDGAYVAAGQRDHRGCRAGRARDRAPAPDDQAWICRASRRAPEGGRALMADSLFGASEFLPPRGDNGDDDAAAQQLARRAPRSGA